MTLKPPEVEAFYDHFGKKQDSQEFYERRALQELVAHAHLADARRVFEFGCGTGHLAAGLLGEHLPSTATYVGCDLSQTMVRLARERLAPYGERAQVLQSAGAVRFPLPDQSVDRVISTYVLDLLARSDSMQYFREAHRVLMAGGRVCLCSLTAGNALVSRTVSGLWSLAFRLRPSWVGGCRPIRLGEYVQPNVWRVEYQNTVTSFGVPSEVLIAQAK